MSNVPLVDEAERLEDLFEEVDDVLLEGHHVVLQDRLEVAVRGAAKREKGRVDVYFVKKVGHHKRQSLNRVVHLIAG